jgi:hypothetical protein
LNFGELLDAFVVLILVDIAERLHVGCFLGYLCELVLQLKKHCILDLVSNLLFKLAALVDKNIQLLDDLLVYLIFIFLTHLFAVLSYLL